MSGIPVASEIEAHRQNGKHVLSQLSIVVSDVSASRTIGTVYQNTSGRPMLLIASGNGAVGYQTMLIGSSNPPTINNAIMNSNTDAFCCVLVPENWYYKVDVTSGTWATTKYWVEVAL